jgi:hypothetical protein
MGAGKNLRFAILIRFMLADKAKDGLSCGIAVTPVVDWRFYGKYKVNLIPQINVMKILV